MRHYIETKLKNNIGKILSVGLVLGVIVGLAIPAVSAMDCANCDNVNSLENHIGFVITEWNW